jgi:SAM-dependent methyltransferase
MAALYSRVAPTYVEQGVPRFAYAGRRLVELAGVGPGDSVLDVATGRGAALFPAAERVGHTGRVVGIDLAEGMLERTRAEDLPPMPGHGAIRRERALVDVLVSAGFEEAREQVEQVELGYRDVETWWASLWTHGSRAPLERLTPDRLATIKAACLERAQTLSGPHGLPETHQFVFVTARRVR